MLNHFKSLGTLVEGTIPNFRPSNLSFPTPQKYVPERKHNYVDEVKDNASEYHFDAKEHLNNFDFLNDIPINSGYRFSELGFNEIPEIAAFAKNKLFDIFSKKETSNEESFLKNGEFVIPSGNLDLGLDDE